MLQWKTDLNPGDWCYLPSGLQKRVGHCECFKFSKVCYMACSWAFCFLISGVVFPHIVTVKKIINPKGWYLRHQWLFKGSEHLNTWANEEVAITGDNIISTLPITIFHQLHSSSEATYKLFSLAVFPQVLLHCKSLLNHVQYFPEITFCFWKHWLYKDDGLLVNC